MLTGYEQVRSVMAAISGDVEAARDVQLVLAETGVCSSDPDEPACRGSEPEPGSAPKELPVLVGAGAGAGDVSVCCR